MVKNEERDRPVAEDEIETIEVDIIVTEQMVRIGRDMLYGYDRERELEEDFVSRLYATMRRLEKLR
jgi:hypothetical protein